MQPDGLAVVMEADHYCMQWRGVKDTDSKMINSVMRGSFLKDPNVKGIFINIFGGIVRCERIAHGVIEAAKEVKINVPLVVRLQGTNAEEGRKLLAESGLKLEVADDLWEAAQKIVKLTGKAA